MRAENAGKECEGCEGLEEMRGLGRNVRAEKIGKIVRAEKIGKDVKDVKDVRIRKAGGDRL